MKLLLFSDLHLDTAFRWLRPEAARRRRQSLRDVLIRIVDLAQAEGVDAVLCGGDLYEHDRFTPDTAQFVRSAFERLAPIRVFVAPGNHDWYSERSLYRAVSWSPNVHVFSENRPRPVELEAGLTLWGAAHLVPANTPNLIAGFHVDRQGVHIALLHGSERAWFVEQEEGKAPHAPFDAVDIERARLDHALLGHFHRPKMAELFTYPGNPDPLAFGEIGDRGAVLVEIAPNGAMTRETRHVAISSVHDVEVDLTGCESQQDVRDQVGAHVSGLSGAVRLTLTGELARDVELDVRALESSAPHLDGLAIRAEGLRSAHDFEAIAQEPTVRGQFVRDVTASTTLDPDQRRRVLLTGLRALDGRDDLEVP
jgi:DNA repair protein SbcD/Mre11